jgi:hypothetical protein
MFEVGKKYRDNEGKIITITGMTDSNTYPVQGINDSTGLNSYTLEGHFYDDCRHSEYNLIEGEVIDTPFKVGSKYYTRNGDVAKIIKSTEGLTYALDVEIKSQIYSFTTEGKFYNTGLDDGHDLMFDQGVVEEDTVEEGYVEPESYEEIAIDDVVVSKTFSNQQDVWAYLMLGGLVQNTINSEVYGFYRGILTEYDIHGDTKFSLLVVPCDIGFTYVSQWVKHTSVERRWEDNLQLKNVLCWVSDQDDTFDMLRLVKTYVKGDNYPYEDEDANTWAYATPLTLENVTPLIYECQKA